MPCDPFLFSVYLSPSDADPQEEQEAHLRAHLQGGRSRGQEGLLRPQALRDRVRAQPPGHQGHAGEGGAAWSGWWALNGINKHACSLAQSLKSRGYVTERFSWQYYYWYLTNDGMEGREVHVGACVRALLEGVCKC